MSGDLSFDCISCVPVSVNICAEEFTRVFSSKDNSSGMFFVQSTPIGIPTFYTREGHFHCSPLSLLHCGLITSAQSALDIQETKIRPTVYTHCFIRSLKKFS